MAIDILDYHYDIIRLQMVENQDCTYPSNLMSFYKKPLSAMFSIYPNIPLGLIGKGVLINQHLFWSINGSSVACEIPKSKLEIQYNIGRVTNLTYEWSFVLTPSSKTKTMLIPTLWSRLTRRYTFLASFTYMGSNLSNFYHETSMIHTTW